MPSRRDRATRLLTYLAECIVNGGVTPGKRRLPRPPPVPPKTDAKPPPGTRDRLREIGPEKFSAWLREQKKLCVTDTTMRDAHQSLLATRMRTYDMLPIAPTYAARHAGLFSLEMWGGATFDAA